MSRAEDYQKAIDHMAKAEANVREALQVLPGDAGKTVWAWIGDLKSELAVFQVELKRIMEEEEETS